MEILGRKLSDKIITDGVRISSFLGARNEEVFSYEEGRLQRVVRENSVFHIQNVADYLRAFYSDESWKGSDLPCIAPPYPSFFMEYRTAQSDAVYNAGIKRAGILFETQTDKTLYRNTVDPKDLDATKWILRGTVIHDNGDLKPMVTTSHDLFVMEDGRLLGNGESLSTLVCERLGGKSAAPEDQVDDLVRSNLGQEIFTSLLAVSFMHCHGARTRVEEPPVKLSKRHEKKTGHPLTKYHIIDIDPLRELLLKEGQVESHGLVRALHEVRGHFADYREKGLFGRTQGIFWKPDHRRGDIESGQVIKDYNI